MNFYIESVYCGIIAYVVSVMLTDTEMIFARLYTLIDKLPKFLSKPLLCCEYCFGGQIALFIYLWLYIASYSVLSHILFICVSILTVEFIKQTINKLK